MDETPATSRPTLVTILAVLTLIWSGAYFAYMGLEAISPELELQSIELPAWITIILVATQLGKTAAAILLLRMKRIGFFAYAGLEVISAIASIISGKIAMEYMDSTYVNPDLPYDPKFFVLILMGMSVGLSVLFIGGFAAHLAKMR